MSQYHLIIDDEKSYFRPKSDGVSRFDTVSLVISELYQGEIFPAYRPGHTCM